MTAWWERWRAVPGLVPLARRLRTVLRGPGGERFDGSAEYWRARYAAGGHSGVGSYGKFAQFKAGVLNGFFAEMGVQSVIEFGCGDGNQLRLLEVPDYLGVDISPEAIARCRAQFAGVPGRQFALVGEDAGRVAECALSLDVIFHLVEDTAYEAYMRRLFAAATRYVVIYASNRAETGQSEGLHVRHRRFSDWVDAEQPGWVLLRHVPNAHPFRGDYRSGSYADFFIYAPRGAPAA